MCTPGRLAPHRIEEPLIAEDLRRRVIDARVVNQDLRQLRGLVGRASRRQTQPAGVLLLLLGRHAITVRGAKVLLCQRDHAEVRFPVRVLVAGHDHPFLLRAEAEDYAGLRRPGARLRSAVVSNVLRREESLDGDVFRLQLI
jgi:hypothetical protein